MILKSWSNVFTLAEFFDARLQICVTNQQAAAQFLQAHHADANLVQGTHEHDQLVMLNTIPTHFAQRALPPMAIQVRIQHLPGKVSGDG
jgi:hypothetical protein